MSGDAVGRRRGGVAEPVDGARAPGGIPSKPGERPRRIRDRPTLLLFGVLAIALVAAFLARPQGERSSDRVTIRSSLRTTPDGIAAFARAIERLGRPVAPRFTPLVEADPVRGTFVLIRPRLPLTPREITALLDLVRGGGTLVHVPVYRAPAGLSRSPRRSQFMDSIGVRFRYRTQEDQFRDRYLEDPAWASHPLTAGLSDEVGRLTHGFRFVDAAGEVVPLLTVRDSEGQEWMAAAEMRLGEGRVTVLSESRPLSNGNAAESPLAALAIRAVLAGTAAADTVFFAEFHQEIGGQRSQAETLADFATGHPVGRVLLHLSLVVFLALACGGLRFGAPTPTVAPPDRKRRSPLEHVSALGDLYRKAGASRTAALLLLARLARAARLPPPRDTADADALLTRLEGGEGPDSSLARVRRALHANPPELAAIAAGIDEHLARRAGS